MTAYKTKQQCLTELSEAGLSDGAHWKRQRDTFYCRRTGCSFHASIEPDVVPQDAEYIEDSYHITTYGVHQHDPNEEFQPKPLPEHLKAVTVALAASGLSGVQLAHSVSGTIGVKIPVYITRKLERDTVKADHQSCWGRMLPLLELLNSHGFPVEWIPVPNTEGESLKFCYVETPFAKTFLESGAFVGVAFLDGAHTTSVAKHTMLAVCTVSADHKIIPLAIAMVDGENNASYEFFMKSMRKGAFAEVHEATILADQHKSIEHGMKVFTEAKDEDGDLIYDYIQVPCIHHLLKKMKGKKEFKEVVVADHAAIFRARKEKFQQDHESEFERLGDVLEKIAFKGSQSVSDRCFGYIADSPVESMNAALKEARREEFFYLIPRFLEWALEQREAQLSQLPEDDDDYCQAAVNTVRRRRALAADLAVRRVTNVKYIVSDAFSERITTQYTVVVYQGMFDCHCGEYGRTGIACKHIYAVEAAFPDVARVPEPRECYLAGRIREGLRANARLEVPALDDLEEREMVGPGRMRQAGRPRTYRLRPLAEHLQNGCRLKRKCGYCGEKVTHTKRSCPVRKEDERKAEEEANGRRKRGRRPGSIRGGRTGVVSAMTTRARAATPVMMTRSGASRTATGMSERDRLPTGARRRMASPSPTRRRGRS